MNSKINSLVPMLLSKQAMEKEHLIYILDCLKKELFF